MSEDLEENTPRLAVNPKRVPLRQPQALETTASPATQRILKVYFLRKGENSLSGVYCMEREREAGLHFQS